MTFFFSSYIFELLEQISRPHGKASFFFIIRQHLLDCQSLTYVGLKYPINNICTMLNKPVQVFFFLKVFTSLFKYSFSYWINMHLSTCLMSLLILFFLSFIIVLKENRQLCKLITWIDATLTKQYWIISRNRIRFLMSNKLIKRSFRKSK